MQDFNEKPCYFQGNYIPLKNANVNIQTHALQYGTAFFGGIRGYWNPDQNNLFVFRLDEHYKRLKNSSRILQMNFPYSFDQFQEITLNVIRKGEWKQNVYLRPFVYKSALELSPRLHNVQDDFALYAIPLNDYLDTKKGLRAQTSSWRRISDNQIPTRSKASGGYINSALAKSEALQNGFDEAIFLDERGFVSEGSAENLFFIRDREIITPSVTSAILEGITRKSIIALAQQKGYAVKEREVSRTEMYVADEVFFAGTGVQIAWLREIDYRQIGNGSIGEITKDIQDTFFDIVTGKMEEYRKWILPVY